MSGIRSAVFFASFATRFSRWALLLLLAPPASCVKLEMVGEFFGRFLSSITTGSNDVVPVVLDDEDLGNKIVAIEDHRDHHYTGDEAEVGVVPRPTLEEQQRPSVWAPTSLPEPMHVDVLISAPAGAPADGTSGGEEHAEQSERYFGLEGRPKKLFPFQFKWDYVPGTGGSDSVAGICSGADEKNVVDQIAEEAQRRLAQASISEAGLDLNGSVFFSGWAVQPETLQMDVGPNNPEGPLHAHVQMEVVWGRLPQGVEVRMGYLGTSIFSKEQKDRSRRKNTRWKNWNDPEQLEDRSASGEGGPRSEETP